VSAQDPGGATGKTPYQPTRCTCGQLSTLHKPMPDGKLGACSDSNCHCGGFTEVVHLVADGHAVTVCCDRTPFVLPAGERVTVDPQRATCPALTEESTS
jgi:hypothetical protein